MTARRISPLLCALLLAGCPDEDDKPGGSTVSAKNIDIPDEWQSEATLMAIRITNSTTTATPTHRALTKLFNERLNIGDMVMRGGLAYDEQGNLVPPGTPGGSDPSKHEEMLGGSAVQQARAYIERTDIDGDGTFPKGAAVDACGNEMIAAFVTPDTLQHVLAQSPTAAGVWPEEVCGTDVNCNNVKSGVWDVAFSETRFDGMLDMVVMVSPNTSGKTTQPGLWGHFVAYFLTENNPGFSRVPLFANIRHASVSIMGLMQNSKMYADELGMRETYVFPHSARTLSGSDVIVSLIGHDRCGDLWDANFGHVRPFGCEQNLALTLERGTPTGAAIDTNFIRGNPMPLNQIVEVFQHQIGAAVSCPSVDEPKWIREPPVEIFLCPDGDIDMCIGREDAEDFACEYLPLRHGLLPVGAPEDAVLGNAAVTGSRVESTFNLTSGDTFRYTVGGQERTLTVNINNPVASAQQVADHLNQLAASAGIVTFSAGPAELDGSAPVVVSLTGDPGPTAQLEIGAGTLNGELGFAPGTYGHVELSSGKQPFELHSAAGSSTGYIAVDLPLETRIYTDEPGRVLGLYSSSGQELTLPAARPNSHCEVDGPQAIDIPADAGARVYLKVQTGAPLWVMASDPQSWIP